MEQNNRLEYLFQKYLDKTCSLPEKDELFEYVRQSKYDDDLKVLLERTWNKEFSIHEQSSEQVDSIFKNIVEYKPAAKVRAIIPNWRKWAVAASIILALGTGYFLLFNKEQQPKIVQTQEQRFKNDAGPGSYKAKLTLGNGRTIVLDSANIGELTKEGSTIVINRNGELVYQTEKEVNHEVFYNTLTTSRGETYATVLSDGSKVWLNSASSIKFPVTFVGDERMVSITGEAYFEVTHNEKMPFKVQLSDGTVVEDLGTEFNINAYSNEPDIRTTLIKGLVKVSLGKTEDNTSAMTEVVIKPGQQVTTGNGKLSVNNKVDIDETLAWKNGRFYFENSSVETIMRQVERWYDVDVSFEDKIPNLFVAKIPRDVPVSELLKLLELTERVHFKIEGKKITVIK